MYDMDLLKRTDTVNELLARYGVKFGIYKNNTFNDQLFPFDAIPRIIEADEFDYLERGLKQRVMALNLFLKDIYSDKKIVKDKVIPEEFIFSSAGYMAECEGVTPIKDIYSHISGIDLVQGKDKHWYILEDNLRVPSGASYPMIARDLCRRSSPATFKTTKLEDNRNYAKLLKQTMDYVNTGGINVVLTPGRYNAAYFEHSYLAEKTGAHLVSSNNLRVVDDKLYCECGHYVMAPTEPSQPDPTDPSTPAPGDDEEPETGDITGLIVFGAVALIAMVAAVAYTFKRKFAK